MNCHSDVRPNKFQSKVEKRSGLGTFLNKRLIEKNVTEVKNNKVKKYWKNWLVQQPSELGHQFGEKVK